MNNVNMPTYTASTKSIQFETGILCIIDPLPESPHRDLLHQKK